MGIVVDRVNALKTQLNNAITAQISSSSSQAFHATASSIYLLELNASLATLSTQARATPTLKQINRLIINVNHARLQEASEVTESDYAKELEWLFLARCSVDIYGCILEQLFQQTLPLARDMFYWNDVLSQPIWRLLFLIQTTPYRLIRLSKAVYQSARAHIHDTHTYFSLGTLRASLFGHNLFRRIAFPTGLPLALAAINLSFDSLCRHEIETNIARLRVLRESQAAGLGLLVSEGMDFATPNGWKEGVVRGVDMMKSTMEWLQSVDFQTDSFKQIDEEFVQLRSTPVLDIDSVRMNLLNLAQNILPNQGAHTSTLASIHGRPSRITRYWPIALTLVSSGSSISSLLFNKRAELTTWIRDFYTTVIDFWQNWVITPILDIVGTIRHEDSSQIALLGRQSLEADMDSLERMVVEFAMDNTQYLPLDIAGTPDALEIIRRGVREGDLSPVLRAYESDLRTPLRSALTGTLIRTLLIQIQKTKVDVDVALSGIDRLLKSQQLVFAFIGVTPSIIILYTVIQYLSALPSRRRGLRLGVVKSDLVKTMRNIERILCLHDPKRGDVLTFRDRGLLLCECYVASEFVGILPRGVRKEFMDDLGDLENVRLGVESQLRTVARMWRVWGKYLV